ncbi:MAG: DUF3175 domain-containing protein [Steroidobacteraceae bacterium]
MVKRKANGRSHGSSRSGSSKRRQKSPKAGTRWSQRVMQTSDALDLEPGVFLRRTSREIALSLKRSAEASRRRKSEPYRSAMSMLTFHVNRAGKGLTPERRRVLNQAKDELRAVFHREPRKSAHASGHHSTRSPHS